MLKERQSASLSTGASHGLIDARLPVAPAHDRRHADAQTQSQDAKRLSSRRQAVRRVSGPFAGHGDRRGPAELSVAPLPITASLMAAKRQCLGCYSEELSANRGACRPKIVD